MQCNIAIIGAGPAGLAAARCLVGMGLGGGVVLVDAGPSIDARVVRTSGEFVTGSGGAALCNDGKWSFGTAGSALAYLDADARARALAVIQTLLGLEAVPSLPDDSAGDPTPVGLTASFVLKRYPSIKTDTATRVALVKGLEESLKAGGVTLLWSTLVSSTDFLLNKGLHVLFGADGGVLCTARAVINATGRLGPMSLPLPRPATTFKRLSCGVRLFFSPWADDRDIKRGVLNPTWIWNTEVVMSDTWTLAVQYRSFCWCTGGRGVVPDLSDIGLGAMHLVSGTTDPAPGVGDDDDDADTDADRLPLTGTNVGLMARIVTSNPILQAEFDEWCRQEVFVALDPRDLGGSPVAPTWRAVIEHGVRQFIAEHDLKFVSHAVGPCVEGVGEYPAVDRATQRMTGVVAKESAGWRAGEGSVRTAAWHHMHSQQYFAAGDCAGHVRGLVPAFVSGWVAGERAAQDLALLDAVKGADLPISGWPAGPGHGALVPRESASAWESVVAPLRGVFTPTGGNRQLLFEGHVFAGPVDPSPLLRDRYYKAADAFNAAMGAVVPDFKPMKTPFLSLAFVGGKAVNVMQSARYVVGNDVEAVVRAVHELDAALFRALGFPILRVKVELAMRGVAPSRPPVSVYSEHHIRVVCDGISVEALPTDEELGVLDALARDLREDLGLPVALSYNRTRTEADVDGRPGRKRFLNVRFRGLGAPEAFAHVARVREAVAARTGGLWKATSPIDEWVVFDSNVGMDRGWIDPEVNTAVALVGPTFSGKSTLEAMLVQEAARMGLDLRVVRMADDTKARYCAAKGLDPDFFEDRARKEAARLDLAAYALDRWTSDPEGFVEPARRARFIPGHVGTVLVPDLRLGAQYSALVGGSNPASLVTVVRVEVSGAVRAARGFVPSPSDATVFESDWTSIPVDRVVRNDGSLDDLREEAKRILGAMCGPR